MAVYLVQHGKAFSKDEDPERHLTEGGIKEVTRIAETAKGYHVKVSSIRHSGIARASLTADIFASFLDIQDVEAVEGMAPNDDVISFSDRISVDDNTMFVGHMPFMERLSAYLLTGKTDHPVIKFQNGGIVCLESHPDRYHMIIKWCLMPKIG